VAPVDEDDGGDDDDDDDEDDGGDDDEDDSDGDGDDDSDNDDDSDDGDDDDDEDDDDKGDDVAEAPPVTDESSNGIGTVPTSTAEISSFIFPSNTSFCTSNRSSTVILPDMTSAKNR
jgi:hypothetical protein